MCCNHPAIYHYLPISYLHANCYWQKRSSTTTMTYHSVLITGCSKGGIGSELAFSFQKAGLKVFATARNTSKIDPTLVKLPNVEVVQLDVVSAESIASAVKAVSERLDGCLDILVNNSGSGQLAPWTEADFDEARRVFDVNFWGVWDVTRAFMPLLLKSKGMIVNNTSVVAYAWQPYHGMPALRLIAPSR